MNIDTSCMSRVGVGNTHKATAKVGRDTIEDAEYFVFEHTIVKRDKTFKDKLEDFWDAITTPYYVVRRWVRRAYWECRYGFQRMFRGYDCVDTFEIYDRFIERYTKVLTELRNKHDGYPCNLSEEKWDEILDEMIYHLYYMKEPNVIEELERDVPEDWSPSFRTVGEIMDRHKNEFFKLFSEYFYNLWD